MPSKEVERFAESLVHHVRDASIRSCDAVLQPTARHKEAQRWQQAAESGDWRRLAKEVIADCVDDTLFYLLHAIDEGLLPLSYTSPEGTMISLQEAGKSELAGWYAGSPGWRKQYSKERVNDDLDDLDLASIGIT